MGREGLGDAPSAVEINAWVPPPFHLVSSSTPTTPPTQSPLLRTGFARFPKLAAGMLASATSGVIILSSLMECGGLPYRATQIR